MKKHFVIQTIAGASLLMLSGVALAQVDAYTNAPAYVYAGPSPDYPAVAQVPPGVPLSVMGCVEGYAWCDVAAPNLRGWVYGGDLSSPYEGENVPLMTYGVQIGLPVIGFSIDSYWDHYYRGRPWYQDEAHWANHPPPSRGAPLPGGGEAGRQPGPVPGRQSGYGRAPDEFPQRGGAPQQQIQQQGRLQPQPGFQPGPGPARAVGGTPQPHGGPPPAQRGAETRGGNEHEKQQDNH